MRLKYEIKFLDYWHASSGLSAGAKLDSSVVRDRDGFPYLSGKTLKGLAREMAEELNDSGFVLECFGDEGTDMGECYFSNAVIPKETKNEILENGLLSYLYDEVASTRIGENGVAADNSLREIEVVVPLGLEGEIDDVPEKYLPQMKRAVKMVKRLGLGRSRGLGRCEISVEVSDD